MANYEEMSIEELELEQTRLYDEAKAVGAERHALAAVLDSKRTRVEVLNRVARMSDVERQQMAQALGVSGIPSGEAVGEPGA